MERDRSTVYRELKRNTGQRGYRPKQAQHFADECRYGDLEGDTMVGKERQSALLTPVERKSGYAWNESEKNA